MLCVRECMCVRVCVSGTLIRAGHHFHFRIRGLRLKRALVSLLQLHCSAEQPAPWWLMLLTCAYRKPGNLPPRWASHRMCMLSRNVTDRQTGRPITFRDLPLGSSPADTRDKRKKAARAIQPPSDLRCSLPAFLCTSQSRLSSSSSPAPPPPPPRSGAGHDHGPLVRRRLLRRHRHRPRAEVPQGSGAGGLL